MFDLADFDLSADAERGTTVELLNPVTGVALTSDDGRPITITVKGADSETYEDAQFDARHRAQFAPEASRERRDFMEDLACHVLGKVTAAWEGVAVEGSAWECNAEAATALYRRFPWIRAQVDAAVNDRRRYAKAVAEAA